MKSSLAILFSVIAAVISYCQCNNYHNNWAVIVSTSRYFFNYRHSANALAMYTTIKSFGIPDSNIILMLADDHACNPRNIFNGDVYLTTNHKPDYYSQDDVEVDYKGNEVTVDSFTRVLSGRHREGTPLHVRLRSDENSNVLVYLTGHGGEGFLKFHDSEELISENLYHGLNELVLTKRARRIMVLLDTCKAASLGLPSPSQLLDLFYSKPSVGRVSRSLVLPNDTIVITSSSNIENSYSANHDVDVGVSLIDRFTLGIVDFVNNDKFHAQMTVGDLVRFLKPSALKSSPTVLWNGFDEMSSVLDLRLLDFFSNLS